MRTAPNDANDADVRKPPSLNAIRTLRPCIELRQRFHNFTLGALFLSRFQALKAITPLRRWGNLASGYPFSLAFLLRALALGIRSLWIVFLPLQRASIDLLSVEDMVERLIGRALGHTLRSIFTLFNARLAIRRQPIVAAVVLIKRAMGLLLLAFRTPAADLGRFWGLLRHAVSYQTLRDVQAPRQDRLTRTRALIRRHLNLISIAYMGV